MSEPLLKLEQVTKTFGGGLRALTVLREVNLAFSAGDSVSIVGPSGSGKSTLLHIVGTLDEPTAGSVLLEGRDPFALSERDLARFRNASIGFVFQDHHLLPQYSVLENVLLPTRAFADSEGSEDRARDLLARVGLSERLDHRPAELSGGERQRVAIARALINKPRLMLCDEPTGNLDQKTAETVSQLLFQLHNEESNLLIIVTHSTDLADRCGRPYAIQDGKLVAAAS